LEIIVNSYARLICSIKTLESRYKKGNPLVASEESARRYYSVKELSKLGMKNVFKPIYPPKQ